MKLHVYSGGCIQLVDLFGLIQLGTFTWAHSLRFIPLVSFSQLVHSAGCTYFIQLDEFTLINSLGLIHFGEFT